jgi:hypothetical protein
MQICGTEIVHSWQQFGKADCIPREGNFSHLLEWQVNDICEPSCIAGKSLKGWCGVE